MRRGYDTPLFDFDGDGLADFATIPGASASEPVPDVRVYLGNRSSGTPTFLTLPVRLHPLGVREDPVGVQYIGDFDGDGYSDLAYAAADLQVAFGGTGVRTGSIEIAAPSDVFGTFQSYRLARVPRIIAALGDINNDGRADLAVADFLMSPTLRSQRLSIVLGNAARTLRPAVEYTGSAVSQVVRSADCRRPSGRIEHYVLAIAAANPLSQTTAIELLSVSDRAIRRQAVLDSPTFNSLDDETPVLEDVGDPSGDGRPFGFVRLTRNRSQGYIVRVDCGSTDNSATLTAQSFALPANAVGVSRSADLNSDGAHELFVSRYGTASTPVVLSVWASILGAPFEEFSAPPQTFRNNQPPADIEQSLWRMHAFGSPGDINGDGWPDLPVGSVNGDRRNEIRVYWGGPTPANWWQNSLVISDSATNFGRYVAWARAPRARGHRSALPAAR